MAPKALAHSWSFGDLETYFSYACLAERKQPSSQQSGQVMSGVYSPLMIAFYHVSESEVGVSELDSES